MTSGGPIDSVRTDRAGRYRVGAAQRDTAAVYIVSVTYDGIAYFSRPLHAFRATGDTAGVLAVFDTSSTEPPIELAQRHLVVRHPENDGSHTVLELLVLRNAGSLTRIAPDTAHPVWQGLLPTGAVELQVGESDVSSDAVYRRGDSIAVAAPIPPGDKQVVVSYVVPSSQARLTLRLNQPVQRLDVFLEDSTSVVEGNALERVGNQSIEGQTFLRFSRSNAPAGTPIAVRFGRRLTLERWWWLIVGAAASVMGAGLVLAWRRTRPSALAAVASPNPDVLAAEIAALDTAFEARSDVSSAERAAYERRRAELKAQLENILTNE
jgi:hypothetical protein